MTSRESSPQPLYWGRAFGLSIRSTVPLPRALLSSHPNSETDVSIVQGSPAAILDVPATPLGHRFASGQAVISCGEGVLIRVEHGERVVVPSGADIAAIQGCLVGPVLGVVVLQRGWLALHASAADINGVAVGICASSGIGKSVTVAALNLKGCPLLTDDVLAVSTETRDLLAIPAYPLVKLWPQGAEALELDVANLDLIEPDVGKFLLDVGDGFQREPVPLGAVLILEHSRQAAASVTELSGGEAVAALVEHSYGVSALRQTGKLDRHFEQITDLVRRIPVARLHVRPLVPPGEVADAVREVVADLTRASMPQVP